MVVHQQQERIAPPAMDTSAQAAPAANRNGHRIRSRVADRLRTSGRPSL
jgi:hypothetical protein